MYAPRKQSKRTLIREQALDSAGGESSANDAYLDLATPENQLPHQAASADASEDLEELSWLHQNILQRLFLKSASRPSDSPSNFPSAEASSAHSKSKRTRNVARLSHLQLLSSQDMERYLLQYARLQCYFPFVPLPQGWSVDSMKEEHPFLLLGILSAMSIHQADMNIYLHTDLLRVIAERAVIEGERSLDIIQGILVQLAWYAALHPFTIVTNSQALSCDLDKPDLI